MKKLNTQQFIVKAIAKHKKVYDYSLVEYKLSRIKVKIICYIHGTFMQRPNDHLMGCGCPTCKFEKIAGQKRGNVQEFSNRAAIKHNTLYDYTRVIYKNANTKVDIICPIHGVFLQTPDKHLSGTGCPSCSILISKGEKYIATLLNKMNIQFEREKRFSDLPGHTKNSRLRYDFWLPNHKTLIEYDGEQHFRPIRIKGKLTEKQAIEKYKQTVVNDKKKNDYATENGYNLIRIKYDQSNILHIFNRHGLYGS
jgi:very-short-patch-repair endonuclease